MNGSRMMNYWLRRLCRECCNRPDVLSEEELALVMTLAGAPFIETAELAVLLGDLVPRIRSQDAA